MTNFQKWMAYTDGLSSPQNFLEWSWRFAIGAALQRRVAFGGDPKHGHMCCFPNTYTILVAKAGVGKGISINPVTELLRALKRKDLNAVDSATDDKQRVILNAIDTQNNVDAEEAMTKSKSGEKIDPPLFPYAPDATTYESLVEGMSMAFRRMQIIDKQTDEHKMDIYGHCSMYFSLPELGSLLRKRTDDTVNFLLGLYDNPTDYEYKTKTKGQDRVRRACLSILAGTTPEFMETVFDQRLIDQGFSSRTFFVYAAKNRKNVFSPAALTNEQKLYRLDLINHLKKLASLYGEATITPETRKWLDEWWERENSISGAASSLSPKLQPYKARKNIHLIKVALQEHFSESTSMEVPLECFQRAAEILNKEEKNMHIALTFEGANPLGRVSDQVMEYLRSIKETDIVDLVNKFWKNLPQGKKSMDDVVEYLTETNQITAFTKETTAGKIKVYYKIVGQLIILKDK